MKKVTLIAAAIVLASACASDDINKKAVENFDDANRFFVKGKFEPAQTHYQRVLDEAPDSPYRLHALLGVADSYYLQDDLISAAPTYQRFVELYPEDERTPHALFYLGMTYFKDMMAVKRDQTNAKKALDTFGQFIEKFPAHFAVPFAKEKTIFLIDRLAEKAFIVAKFYCDTTAWGACIGRVDDLLAKYPDSRFKAQALLMKGKAFIAEEAFEKAKPALLRTAMEFPGSAEGIEANKLLDLIANGAPIPAPASN